MGAGGFAEPPKQTAAYRRGYLCGLIRGDGSDGHYAYPQLDRPADRTFLFRLPLAGSGEPGRAGQDGRVPGQGGHRVRRLQLPTRPARRGIRAPGADGGPHRQRRTGADAQLAAGLAGPIRPRTGTRASWRASSTRTGATGTGSCGWLRPIRRSTAGWCSRWNPSASATRWNGLPDARASGCAAGSAGRCGSSTTDPAVTTRRSIEAAAVETGDGLRVTGVERLGLQVPMYDITTGTGDFIANGV
jgi:hypothetical protein